MSASLVERAPSYKHLADADAGASAWVVSEPSDTADGGIERFGNPGWRHATLGYESPMSLEAKMRIV